MLPRSVAFVGLLAAGCGPPIDFLGQELDPGDAVIIVLGAQDLSTARLEVRYADARGVVKVTEEPGALAAFVIVRARDVVDIAGKAQSLAGISADLGGDRATGCSCRVSAVGARQQIVSPGDRCALTPASSIDVAPRGASQDSIIAQIRARLRVTWPGTCACELQPFAETSEVAICPLGDGAARLHPSATAIGADGTVYAIARDRVVEIAIDGQRRETAVAPALPAISAVLALSSGALIIHGRRDHEPGREYLLVPKGGAGPARVANVLPIEDRVVGAVPTNSGALWLHGITARDGSRPFIAHCNADAEQCSELPFPNIGECEQVLAGKYVRSMAELEGGDLAVLMDSGALAFVHDGQLVCVPGDGAPKFPRLGSARVTVESASVLVAVGRRLATCVNANASPNLALVVTATVGALAGRAPSITWQLAQERMGSGAFCGGSVFVDPHDPDHAVMRADTGPMNDTYLRFSRSSTVVESVAGTYFPELRAAFGQVATSSAGIAITTEQGETYARRGADSAMVPLIGFSRFQDREARAILRVPGGFRVYTGGAAPIHVRVAPDVPGCAGVELDAPAAAYDVASESFDDAVTTFGTKTLLFGRRNGKVQMSVRDADDDVEATVVLPHDAWIQTAVEVVPGAWVALLRSDHTLWATDGRETTQLDPFTLWRHMDAVPGAAFVLGSNGNVARIAATSGGVLAVEHVSIEEIDTSEFDHYQRRSKADFSALHLLCDGRALIGYSEQPLDPDGEHSSAWVLAPHDGRMALHRYSPLVSRLSGPIGGQEITLIAGEAPAPLLVFSGTGATDGIHAPGIEPTALPFYEAKTTRTAGPDALFGSAYLRMAVVRVTP